MSTPIQGIDSPDPTSLQSANFHKPFVLADVVRKLSRMTEILQKVAAAQAGGLTLYANWQKAYTDLMAVVPSGPATTPAWATATDDATVAKRGNLSRAIANISSTLQNRQSIVSDLAKALQSAVNQTNDAVNQQSSVGSTFLQSVQTLLGSIYK